MSEQAEVNSVADVNADENLLMVAFASSDGECVNQHFGSSRGFHVYGIGNDVATLMATRNFPKEKKDGNEDKLKPKLSWLHGCDLVYVGSVGGSATKQLVMLGATPVVVKGGPEIEEIIEELQNELNGTPSPMLSRVLRQKGEKSENRFEAMDDDGWEE
jgi:nitrogen fixation protein NifX